MMDITEQLKPSSFKYTKVLERSGAWITSANVMIPSTDVPDSYC